MWKLLNYPLPATPQLSPLGFAVFLSVASLLPGLSDFVLATAAVTWLFVWMARILGTSARTEATLSYDNAPLAMSRGSITAIP